MDAAYLAFTIAFFASCAALLWLCERLQESRA